MSTPGDWITPLVGIIKDETTPHRAFICNDDDSAHSLMAEFEKHGIPCWHCGHNSLTGESAVCVPKAGGMDLKACRLKGITNPSKASCFDGCGRIVALGIVVFFILFMLYLCSMAMVMPGG